MATLRLAALAGATKVFLTSLGGTTGTPDVAGYALTQVAGLVHDATITGLTGPFYAVAENDAGTELGYVLRVVMVDDSSVIDMTRDLSADAISSVAAASVTVTPSSSTVASRAGANYVLAYTDETSSISITVLDAAGSAVDLSAKTLGVYWETEAKVAVASLTSGITVGGAGNNVVTFAIPSAVSDSDRRLVFAVRDQAAPKAVYAGGVFSVQHLPSGS